MVDFYKYSRIFQVGPRGSGRTHAICAAAKSINAVVIVPTLSEVTRLRSLYGTEALAIGQIMKHFQGPILFDHSAMLDICRRYEYQVEHLMKKNTEMREILLEKGYPNETN